MSTDQQSDSTPDGPVFNPVLATVKAFLVAGVLFLIVMACGYETSTSSRRNPRERATKVARQELITPREIPPPSTQSTNAAATLRADRIWTKPRPSLLEKGLRLSDVNYLLVVEPKVVYEDINNTSRYSWRLSPTETVFCTFKDDVLAVWATEVIDNTEAPGSEFVGPVMLQFDRPNATLFNKWERAMMKLYPSDGPTYPMLCAASIKKDRLDFHLYDNFNYVDVTFIISSGDAAYFYRLEFLPGAKTTYIKLEEFSREGWRFSPYSHVADTLIVIATRPDGYRSLSMTVFTGNTRK